MQTRNTFDFTKSKVRGEMFIEYFGWNVSARAEKEFSMIIFVTLKSVGFPVIFSCSIVFKFFYEVKAVPLFASVCFIFVLVMIKVVTVWSGVGFCFVNISRNAAKFVLCTPCQFPSRLRWIRNWLSRKYAMRWEVENDVSEWTRRVAMMYGIRLVN